MAPPRPPARPPACAEHDFGTEYHPACTVLLRRPLSLRVYTKSRGQTEVLCWTEHTCFGNATRTYCSSSPSELVTTCIYLVNSAFFDMSTAYTRHSVLHEQRHPDCLVASISRIRITRLLVVWATSCSPTALMGKLRPPLVRDFCIHLLLTLMRLRTNPDDSLSLLLEPPKAPPNRTDTPYSNDIRHPHQC